MTYNDIKIDNRYMLENLTVYNKGYLTGYINCMLIDNEKYIGYETLYRIHDPLNGNDYTLVSVDYGWKIGNDDLIEKVERILTEFSKSLNVDFSELEKTQQEDREDV